MKFLRDSGAIIGKNVKISSIDGFGTEPCLIEIGDNVYFANSSIKLLTHDGGIMVLKRIGLADKTNDLFGKIKIGNNCFIGINATILKNVTIGDNCIIGAGSIVTKSVPPNSVVAGVPARVICTINEYYEKNKENLDFTFGLSLFQKRKYLETNMEKYETRRKQKEIK